MLLAISGWRIMVKPMYQWTSASGEMVGGETHLDFHIVSVGADLAGLCHELAHVCEDKLEGKVDYTHANWARKGIFRAVDEYMTIIAKG